MIILKGTQKGMQTRDSIELLDATSLMGLCNFELKGSTIKITGLKPTAIANVAVSEEISIGDLSIDKYKVINAIK